MIKKEFCALGKAIEQCQVNCENGAVSTYRLSMLTGITESTLSRIKYGKCSPTRYTMQRIARALNVNYSAIEIIAEELVQREADYQKQLEK